MSNENELLAAISMARSRLDAYADAVNAGEAQGGGREFKRKIWGAFAEFDALTAAFSPPPEPAHLSLAEQRVFQDALRSSVTVVASPAPSSPEAVGWPGREFCETAGRNASTLAKRVRNKEDKRAAADAAQAIDVLLAALPTPPTGGSNG